MAQYDLLEVRTRTKSQTNSKGENSRGKSQTGLLPSGSKYWLWQSRIQPVTNEARWPCRWPSGHGLRSLMFSSVFYSNRIIVDWALSKWWTVLSIVLTIKCIQQWLGSLVLQPLSFMETLGQKKLKLYPIMFAVRRTIERAQRMRLYRPLHYQEFTRVGKNISIDSWLIHIFHDKTNQAERNAIWMYLRHLYMFILFGNRLLCKSVGSVFISPTHRKLHIVNLCPFHCLGCPLMVLFLHLAVCCPSESCTQHHHHLNFHFTKGQCKQGHAKGQLHEGGRLFLTHFLCFHLRGLNGVYHRSQHQPRMAYVV